MKNKRVILTFINEMNCGGAQRVLSNLINLWTEKGYKVVLVTVSSEPSFYSLHKNIQWISLGNIGVAKSTASAVIATVRRIVRLRKILKRYKPEVALSFMPSANVQLALASLGLSHRVVGSERVYPPFAGLTPLWSRARFLAYRFLDSVIVQTNEASDWMKQNITTKNLVVIPNPVILPNDTGEINTEAIVNQNYKYIILAVGRLVPQKGFDILISIFAQLANKYPEWKLCIAGEGTERNHLEKMISNFGLESRIELLGEVSNIESWYKRSSIFVMSSRFEGFPNALAEAMAYGLPVISFDCKTGPRELIKHEINGLLIELGNEISLRESLARLMNDKVLRKKFGLRAVEVKNKFSIEHIGMKYLKNLGIEH